jgi:DNA-directed RNA polymerase subunit K/omega
MSRRAKILQYYDMIGYDLAMLMVHRIKRSSDLGVFELCRLAALRARQLGRGCLPKVDGAHKLAVTALLEIEARAVVKVDPEAEALAPK